jgi:PleD family two-component response regulator
MRIVRESIVNCDGRGVTFRVSMGIAEYNYKDSFDEINKKADAALYFSKNNGRDKITCFDEM